MVLTRAQKILADKGELDVAMHTVKSHRKSITKTSKRSPKRSSKHSPKPKRKTAKKATTKAERRALRLEQEKRRAEKKRRSHLRKTSKKLDRDEYLSSYFKGVRERRHKKTQKARERAAPLSRVAEVEPLDALIGKVESTKLKKLSSSSKHSSDELAGLLNKLKLDKRL